MACLAPVATAADTAAIEIGQPAIAGEPLRIATSGSGQATLYLAGPATRLKRPIQLGESILLEAQQVREAGLYTVTVRSSTGAPASRTFYVAPAAPANINFLAQPSRVPAGAGDAISGTAFVLDAFHNLVLAPVPVKFEWTIAGAPPLSRTVDTRDGVAWVRMDSSRRAGAAQFTASAGPVSVRRIVQQTAAEPCNLRMHAEPGKLGAAAGIVVRTDPVRDCAGNPVPDGTIVTFTALDAQGKSTVDAVVKRGIANAQLPASARATLWVASGVVIGNEIHWGGGQ